MKDGFRSTLIHPEEMLLAINVRMAEFSQQYQPATTMESYLVWEMARTTIQIEICSKQVIIDQARAIERVDTSWDADQSERAERWVQKLPRDPFAAAKALQKTKQGAQILIFHWTALQEAIQTNGGLDEPQRSLAFDLLGIPEVVRNGSRRVPEGTDGPALLALTERELGRLRSLIEHDLHDRDLGEQQAASVGLPRFQDAATRRVKNAESRHQKRLDWAMDALQQLRKGVPAADIIDPTTKKPVDPGNFVPPAPPRSSASASSSSPSPSPPPPPRPERADAAASAPLSVPEEDASSPEPSEKFPPPLPEGFPEELRDLYYMTSAAMQQMRAEAAAQGASGTPPDQPGPSSV
jgi:hypothetical protein